MFIGQSSTGYNKHMSKEAEKYLFYTNNRVSWFSLYVLNIVIFQEKGWCYLGALGDLMGEHGYRDVTFCQSVMIFGGGSKAEVLSDSAVWDTK